MPAFPSSSRRSNSSSSVRGAAMALPVQFEVSAVRRLFASRRGRKSLMVAEVIVVLRSNVGSTWRRGRRHDPRLERDARCEGTFCLPSPDALPSQAAGRNLHGCRSRTTQGRQWLRAQAPDSDLQPGRTRNDPPARGEEQDDADRVSGARRNDRRAFGPRAAGIGSRPRNRVMRGESERLRLPGCVVTKGPIGKVFELAGLNVALELAVPRNPVVFQKPGAELPSSSGESA